MTNNIITKESLLKIIEIFSDVYDIIRLVDPETSSVIRYDENGIKQIQANSCFSIWNNSERCHNCISKMACTRQSKMTKIEYCDDAAYTVICLPYIVMDNDKECHLSLELINKITNASAPLSKIAQDKNKEIEALIANTSGGVISISVINNKIIPVHYSKTICNLLGYTENELFETANMHGFNSLIYPEDIPAALVFESRLLETHQEINEVFRLLNRDSEAIWVDCHGSFALDQNGVELYYLSFDKADAIKSLENRIAVHQKGLLSVLDFADIDYCEYNLVTSSCWMAQKTRERYGVLENLNDFLNVIEKTNIILEEDKQNFLQMLAAIHNGENYAQCEVRIKRANEEKYKWIRYRAYAIFEGDRPVMAVGVGIGIDEFKDVLENFDCAMDMVGIYAWVIDIPTRTANWLNRWDSTGLFDVEYSHFTDLQNFAATNDLVAPEDSEKYQDMFTRLFAGQKHIQEQIRQKTADSNSYTWVEYSSTIIEYEDGRPKTALGTIRDISAEKEMEATYLEEMDNRAVMEPSLISFCRLNLSTNTIEDIIIHGKSITPELHHKAGPFVEEISAVFSEITLSSENEAAFSLTKLIRMYLEGVHETSITYWAKLRSTGEQVWVQTKCRVIKRHHTGHLLAFFYVRDMTDKHLKDCLLTHLSTHSYERSAAIFAKDQMLRPIKEISASYEDFLLNSDYNSGVTQYCSDKLAPKDAAKACKAMLLETVIDNLKDQSEYSVEYDMQNSEGKYRRKRVNFSYIDRENRVILVTRSDIALYEQLKYLSEHDPLTGLNNRKKFFEETQAMIDMEPEKTFFVLHCDIDRFKLYNSAFGNEEGDRLLKYVAKQMVSTTSRYEHCVCGRLQSDVFCLCAVYDTDILLKNLKRVNKSIGKYRSDYMLRFTFGVYVMEDHDVRLEEAVTRAALAARNCKSNINQNYEIFNESEAKKQKVEQEITNEMHLALKEHQFKVYLQPKYDLKTGRAYGAEALVRWHHPTKGIVSPGLFIPLFERNGFIADLDQYMWEEVCILLNKWLTKGYNPTPVSVNISRISLYNPNLVTILKALVDKYKIGPDLLHLEITESAYMSNQLMMQETIDHLHEAGFVILMDDFGSGYSSLNTLKDFHIDVLKIDMKFLPENRNVKRSEIILASVIHMAKWLDIGVIMEGVETTEQNTFLKGVGCDYIQGFYYARPMPADMYEEKYVYTIGNSSESQPQPQKTGESEILVVTDDPESCEMITGILGTEYLASIFNAVEPAMAYLQQNRKKIKLIIADDHLPGMNGMDMFEYCQRDSDLYNIPKMLITSDSDEQTKISAIEHGADDYLVKPVNPCLLTAYVNKWLRVNNNDHLGKIK